MRYVNILCIDLYYRPNDNNPLVSSEEVLVITVKVPQDVPIVSVRLPENTNVEDFTVSVRRPNGQTVPVDNGDVRSLYFSLGLTLCIYLN